MSTAAEGAHPPRDQANELYWNSEDTVDQLASRLGMSRRAVYASVQPTPARAACTSCGGQLVFTNRTNRAARQANCAACGATVALEPAAGATGEPRSAGAENGTSRWRQIKEELASVPPERAAKIGGVAALGVAVGAAAVKAIRDRR